MFGKFECVPCECDLAFLMNCATQRFELGYFNTTPGTEHWTANQYQIVWCFEKKECWGHV